MIRLSKIALWGAWPRFAQRAPKTHISLGKLPRLSPHLARDIGLTDSDQERVKFQWPSEGPDRPNV